MEAAMSQTNRSRETDSCAAATSHERSPISQPARTLAPNMTGQLWSMRLVAISLNVSGSATPSAGAIRTIMPAKMAPPTTLPR
jgi:hypothetical protein